MTSKTKSLFTLMLFACCIAAVPCASAWFENIGVDPEARIIDQALTIELYVMYTPEEEGGHGIKYQYSRAVHPWYHTWIYKVGDCSDVAMLKARIYEEFGIEYRLVHGYANGGLHDWIEFKDEYGNWITFEDIYFGTGLIAEGYGSLW